LPALSDLGDSAARRSLDTTGNPNHRIDIQGEGGEVTVGFTYRFGMTEPALK
jgi:hypothetical protein